MPTAVVYADVRAQVRSPVRADLVTGLPWYQFDIGTPEVMNLGTGNAVLVFIDTIEDWLSPAYSVEKLLRGRNCNVS